MVCSAISLISFTTSPMRCAASARFWIWTLVLPGVCDRPGRAAARVHQLPADLGNRGGELLGGTGYRLHIDRGLFRGRGDDCRLPAGLLRGTRPSIRASDPSSAAVARVRAITSILEPKPWATSARSRTLLVHGVRAGVDDGSRPFRNELGRPLSRTLRKHLPRLTYSIEAAGFAHECIDDIEHVIDGFLQGCRYRHHRAAPGLRLEICHARHSRKRPHGNLDAAACAGGTDGKPEGDACRQHHDDRKFDGSTAGPRKMRIQHNMQQRRCRSSREDPAASP